MPMAAMFTRNRMIGWVSLVFSLQSWLGETPDQKKSASTPAYMSVLMSLMALVVVRYRYIPTILSIIVEYPSRRICSTTNPAQTYFPIFMPPPAARGTAAAAAPSPVPSP
ncbi:uncharacterized protein ACLA_034200 [Aspergillus clavatus NRRL 1]|uniref:Uncharacterized protein n=1 Tax=Aspergillus clavatus (strain ATCC 1007 / CBS 513.65 / DSM 816 / NCTC 3887 / NRRL 1 / QM 1276 / 107) TaxID=344612 RepID=A1CJ93_ASPCL|nr:uncharacterized protein ACLA_034200 [Aspergillus clavatus NRRL 1]EAW09217.1 hypothetical protein ACLA_034200 [Aspergillus clavatus NRRL 1]